MRYKRLGNTGLDVSVIGFGAAPLGNIYGDVSDAEGAAAVHAAIEAGINLFDVSPYYGLTLAEEKLGIALEGKRANILLATKCGRYGVSAFDFSAQTITREFENSLKRLRTDYVDLLQAHDVEFGDRSQIINETIPALRKLQQEGKARLIGITGYWPGLLTSIAEQAPCDTVLNYCHANLLIDDMDDYLTPFAQRTGTGLLNASPLHMGLLGNGPVPPWHPAPAEVKAAAIDVNAICESHGADSATVALHACLEHPVVASTFVGLRSPAQVRAACSALEYLPSHELMNAVRARLASVFNTTWPSGLPQNHDAPSTHRSTPMQPA